MIKFAKHSRFVISAFIPIALCMGLIMAFDWLGHHAPLSDDLSMIAFSKEWSWEWLNKGLADYFIVYPEYYGPQSNFIRPVSNLVYWAFQSAFPVDAPFFANQIQLWVLTYGMLITFAITVFVLFRRAQQSLLIATLGMLSCMLIPTFWTTPSPTYTSFVFDGLAITFCLLALIAFQAERFVLMTIGLSLALMTKEIAFPVILGFTLGSMLTRNPKALGGCVIALLIFFAIRINGFGLHAEGVYVFDARAITLSAYLAEKLRNALSMPFGPVFFEDVFTPSGIQFGDRSSILLIINLGVYSAVLVLFVRAILNSFKRSGKILDLRLQHWNEKEATLLMVTLAALIAFIFDAIVGANYRYAYNFLPFLFIGLAGANMRTWSKAGLFSVILSGSLIASAPSIARLHNHFEFESFRYQSVRDLFDTLRMHQDSRSIIVLNDFVLGYANPRAVEILVPMSGRIIRGTSLYLDSCGQDEISKIETEVEIQSDATYIAVRLPECGRFAFESAPKLAEFASGNMIRRNDQIRYEFEPVPQSSYSSVPGWSGRDLTLIAKEADIVYFDFIKKKWIFLPAARN